jgi:hypothetical protein
MDQVRRETEREALDQMLESFRDLWLRVRQ